MERQLWQGFGILLLISNALGIIVLIETIVYKIPFLTLFIIIMSASIYFNIKLFRLRR